ncbi:hypothetical protein TDB9533_02307 [Thalassocella blandensis]|nr:hypothetical protein TDB9533_02307 [Thalassocella blandensis]
MNILFLGFYADFASFYTQVGKNLVDKGAYKNFIVASCNLSGFVRSIRYCSIFLPFSVRFNAGKAISLNETVLSVSEAQYIGEYASFSAWYSRKLVHLYFNYFIWLIREKKISTVVVGGDTRLQSRALLLAAKKLDVRYFCFEQGPFSTTTFDKNGANCNLSFVSEFPAEHHERSNIFDKRAKRKLSFLRYFDYLCSPLFSWLIPELSEEKGILAVLKRSIVKRLRSLKEKWTFDYKKSDFLECEVLVLGQVPQDANTLLFSNYGDSLGVLKAVLALANTNSVVFREHPLYIGAYGKEFYKYCTDKRVVLSKKMTLEEDIDRAKFIVTINSQAGLEAILRKKRKVFLAGRASYSNINGAVELQNLDLNSDCRSISDIEHKQNVIWFSKNFIEGHFRDVDRVVLINSITGRLNEA